MKKIFVTGGDGFLGSNLVRILLERGYEVAVMVQPGRSTGLLDDLDVTQTDGDLLDQELLIQLTKGFDAIIHIAAVTDVWPTKHPKYWRVNVDGTRNIIEACKANNIQRLVHFSSASVYQYGSKEAPGTEAKFGQPGVLDYIDSKREGHKMVQQAAREEGLPAVVVCPTFMIGAQDSKPSSGAFMINAAKGNMPAYTHGGKNWVYVNDVATAAANALTMGTIGEAYICGHHNMSFLEALTIIGEVTGCKVPKRRLPDAVFHSGGWLLEQAAKLFGFTPKLSYNMAIIGTQGHYFSPAKAVNELNMPQTPLKQAFEEAYKWFLRHNYLP